MLRQLDTVDDSPQESIYDRLSHYRILGFLLWVLGLGLTASLTFETGAPVPIFAAGAIWIGTWLATTSRFTNAPGTARQLEKNDALLTHRIDSEPADCHYVSPSANQ